MLAMEFVRTPCMHMVPIFSHRIHVIFSFSSRIFFLVIGNFSFVSVLDRIFLSSVTRSVHKCE